MNRVRMIFAVLIAGALLPLTATSRIAEVIRARPAGVSAAPAYCHTAHRIGRIVLGVNNDGTLGLTFEQSDCFTGEPIPGCEYLRGSNSVYLFGAGLWVGAVVGEDTLVSTGLDGWALLGAEFHPEVSPGGNMIYRSTIDPDAEAREGAVSEQDFVATYADTCPTCPGVGIDPVDYRPHKPLPVEVTQRSYAWSFAHTDDFVLFDLAIRNIGPDNLSDVYVGLYVDADVHSTLAPGYLGPRDDVTGFLATAPNLLAPPGCLPEVEVNLAWIADNNGDLGQISYPAVPHVTAVSFMLGSANTMGVSYNWWNSSVNPAYDYGPQARTSYRPFGTGGSGTPEGDRNKYHQLSNAEIDYDQVKVATIGSENPVWPPPPPQAALLAEGFDAHYLLSVGPMSLAPGEAESLAFAYVAGENLHSDPANILNLPDDPDAYLSGLDFGSLVTNAIWANWVYDNPGVDSDSDGYAGQYQICGGDTVWYQGDGIPDWRAATPPAAPVFWLEPERCALRVRWNGFESETDRDRISRRQDFEGYHAYLSTSGAPGSFVRVGSYDVEDYRHYCWDSDISDWVVATERLFVDEARCRYAPEGCDDTTWHPSDYSREQPYLMPGQTDSVIYFEPIFANACRFGAETPFVKRYPDAGCPDYGRPADVPADSADVYLTDDGFFKHYEYEFTICDLLPEQEYWVVVTSLDYGSLAWDISALESPVVTNARVGRPLYTDPSCCEGEVGNVNCDPGGNVNIADVQTLIDFLYVSFTPLCCLAEADINGSGGRAPLTSDITIGDIALLIDHLFISLSPLPECR